MPIKRHQCNTFVCCIAALALFVYLPLVYILWDVEASISSLDLVVPNTRPCRLEVPFYVYQDSTLNWENFSFSKQQHPEYSEFKHSDDLWLYRASLRHPQRTLDPNQAKLFFVPFLLNAVSERRMCLPSINQQTGETSERCFERPGHAFRFADKQLAMSKYFQRSGGIDHVIVISHWLAPPRKIPNLLSCNLINFEGRIPIPYPNASFLPSFYVGQPCPLLPKSPIWNKPKDFALVATFKPNMPQFTSRQNICQWLQNYSVSHCGPGQQCPAVAEAKYGFHPRGDTWGSNRVMDLVLSRTIPLFTDPQQYDLLPPFVPWRNLTYLINVSTRSQFDKSLQHLLSRPPSDNEMKRQLIEDYMHLFDHRQIYQFDAYMTEFAKRLSLQ